MTSIHSIWSRMEIKYRWFQDPGEPREGATQASRSEFWLVSIWSAENVWPPRSNLEICSFSGLRSSLLRPDRDVRAGMHGSVQTRAGFSPASDGSAMLSQSNIGPAVAGPAGPAPPPCSRWEQCVSIYLVCHTSHSLRVNTKFASSIPTEGTNCGGQCILGR